MPVFVLLLLVSCFGAVPVGHAEKMLGYVGFRANSLVGLPRWVRVLDALPDQRQEFSRCDADRATCRSEEIFQWREFIQSQQGRGRMEQIQAVNAYANTWPYITDDEAWGRSDYWATPKEFLHHSGDCEDYSILKYVTFLELGFSEQDLRLVVVRDVVRDLAHAVLAVRHDATWYILDSLFDEPVADKYVKQYTPYYSVNGQARWTYIPPLGKTR